MLVHDFSQNVSKIIIILIIKCPPSPPVVTGKNKKKPTHFSIFLFWSIFLIFFYRDIFKNAEYVMCFEFDPRISRYQASKSWSGRSHCVFVRVTDVLVNHAISSSAEGVFFLSCVSIYDFIIEMIKVVIALFLCHFYYFYCLGKLKGAKARSSSKLTPKLLGKEESFFQYLP